MKFTTQEVRSYALTFWEFRSLKSDEFFVMPGHFLDLIPAPQLNQRSEQSVVCIVCFYHCGFASTVLNSFKDDGDRFLFGKLVDKLPHSIHNPFLTQNFNNYNFIFFAKNHRLLLFTQQGQVSAVNVEGTRE